MTTSYSAFGSASGHCGRHLLLPVAALINSDANENRDMARPKDLPYHCALLPARTEWMRHADITYATSDQKGGHGRTPDNKIGPDKRKSSAAVRRLHSRAALHAMRLCQFRRRPTAGGRRRRSQPAHPLRMEYPIRHDEPGGFKLRRGGRA